MNDKCDVFVGLITLCIIVFVFGSCTASIAMNLKHKSLENEELRMRIKAHSHNLEVPHD